MTISIPLSWCGPSYCTNLVHIHTSTTFAFCFPTITHTYTFTHVCFPLCYVISLLSTLKSLFLLWFYFSIYFLSSFPINVYLFSMLL
ncbi:hypothetical protein BDC45DRAFT_508287 [Circinella umbellata]|nr:hypothetical protein BDC45DRAFT_508287 [Circinella umbellata]